MPLPENGATWPPLQVADSLQSISEWAAWYAGDPDQLAAYYARQLSTNVRPSQLASGVVGKLSRWWWGQPQQAGETRSKLHVPLAADIAGTSADLLFAEPPKLHAEDGNQSLQDALDEFGGDGLQAQLHEAGELTAAMGSGYLRVVWDTEVDDLPWLDAVEADGAVPEFRWGRLMAVTFWRRLTDYEHGVWRLLERHEPGRIEHGLYRGSDDNLGQLVPLQDHPEAEHLAEVVDAEGGVDTGTQLLTAVHVPNMLPNRELRGSHLGRSDYQGVTHMLDALDEAYSSWHRDIRLAKARLHVPQSWLENSGPGTAGVVDLERELYVGLNMLDKGDGSKLLDAQQFAIRYAEHSQTCRDWTQLAIRSAGYSVQTFGETGDVAVTATEVHARERRSYLTRAKKIRYWRPALQDILQAWVEVANATSGAGIRPGDITVEFGDAVQDSQLSLAQTAQALKAAEAASTETLVRMVHPDWDDTKVQAEVEAIGGERVAGMPDPMDAGF